MTLKSIRPAAKAKARTLGGRDKLASRVFLFCTLLMLVSVARMWSHWFGIAAALGVYRAAGVLAGITAAALLLSWWLNTGNEEGGNWSE